MLHPHVPEELKHFGKHLLATFLGLLLALGLEQWREHRHELKVTAQALARVDEELLGNTVKLDRERGRAEAGLKLLASLDAFLVAQMEAKRAGRPVAEAPPEGNMGLGLLFTHDAWESLKVVGAFRHLSPDRGARVSRAYGYLQMVNDHATRYPGLERCARDLSTLFSPKRSFREWEVQRFQEMRESVWQLEGFYQWAYNEMGFLRKAFEEARRP